MKKVWILSLPPLASVLTAFVPLAYQLVDGVLCDPNLFSGHFLEHLSSSPAEYFEQYIFPGYSWMSVPTLGPIAFYVTGIIMSTLWFVIAIESGCDDRHSQD